MNILLTAINAKYIHSNPGIYALKAYADTFLREEDRRALHIATAEYTIHHRSDRIVADIYRKKPDILAFSCYIWNWSLIQEVLEDLHSLCPELTVWLGGPEVSYDPDRVLKQYPFVSCIIVGEGEETFLALCGQYLQNRDVPPLPLPGCVTPQGRGADRAPIEMDRLPFYYEDLTDFKHRIIYYESSRGCPYRCSYCLSSIDKSLRLRRTELVKKEVQYFLDESVKQVKFVDRTFNCNRSHALEVWRYIREHDNGITNFHFEISADLLGEEELELLCTMRPGLVQLEIGVQSVHSHTLREIRRSTSMDRLRANVLRLMAGGNVHLHLDLIAGLPYEDYQGFIHSFNSVYAMRPHRLQLGFLKILKGTYMQEMAEEYGMIYSRRPPYQVMATRWLPYERMLRLMQTEEMVELYYNSGQFAYTVAMLEKCFDSPFRLYEALAEFYERKGYGINGNNHPARMYRYRILLEFIRERDGDREEMYRELLTFDLYLRENMKTRPEFAPDLTPFREEIKQIYDQEAKSHTLLPAYETYNAYNARQLAGVTHLEVFRYCVTKKGNCEKLPGFLFAIFDYNERDRITGDAGVIPIYHQQEREAHTR